MSQTNAMDVDVDDDQQDQNKPNKNNNAITQPVTKPVTQAQAVTVISPLATQTQTQAISPSITPPSSINDPKTRKALQSKLREKILYFRRIVTLGCGNWRCLNKYCKSNELNKNKKYSDTEASKLVLNMVKLRIKECKIYGLKSIIPLKYDQLLNISDKDQTKYKHIISEAFKHFDILSSSFLTSSTVSESHCCINFKELDNVFKLIISDNNMCKDISVILNNTINNYLTKITQQYSTKKKLSLNLNELRALIILIECPLILSEDMNCYPLLELFLNIIEFINSNDFKSIRIIHKWFSTYNDLNRLKNLLHSLHQYMTLTINISEDDIEDKTDEWKIELKYDDIDDSDEKDEIITEIEKKQQKEREKYIKNKISKVIKMIDILWISNKIIIKHTADLKKKNKNKNNKMNVDDDNDDNDDDIEEKKQNDNQNQNKNNKKRLSLVGLNAFRQPLPLKCFQNDGLNEIICSRTEQQRYIHRRDFIHYDRSDFFTFLDFPYTLTAGSKSKYLEFENLLRQSTARRNRMFDLMFNRGFMNIPQNQLISELYLVVKVHRNNIIRDSLVMLAMQDPSDLRKRLRIIFDGEEGIDQGGLTKEYFQLIIKELFNVNYGMFIYNSDTSNYWFNRDSFLMGDKKQMLLNYKLVGQLIGIAIYNNTILDLRFPRVIFKKLLQNESINFNDFRDYDPELSRGFEQLLKFNGPGTVKDVYCRNFTIKHANIFGIEQEDELLPNGKNIELTADNREEYIDLYIKYILEDSISEQFNSFLSGFKSVCDSLLFNKFLSEELELLICGSKEFDFDELELSTKYEDGFKKNSRVIIEFWKIVHEYNNEYKRKLLTFCTGSDRVPINGLSDLRLTISKNGNNNNKLPTSHTCFNHLLLPEYSNKEILKKRLMTAIQNSSGFGLL